MADPYYVLSSQDMTRLLTLPGFADEVRQRLNPLVRRLSQRLPPTHPGYAFQESATPILKGLICSGKVEIDAILVFRPNIPPLLFRQSWDVLFCSLDDCLLEDEHLDVAETLRTIKSLVLAISATCRIEKPTKQLAEGYYESPLVEWLRIPKLICLQTLSRYGAFVARSAGITVSPSLRPRRGLKDKNGKPIPPGPEDPTLIKAHTALYGQAYPQLEFMTELPNAGMCAEWQPEALHLWRIQQCARIPIIVADKSSFFKSFNSFHNPSVRGDGRTGLQAGFTISSTAIWLRRNGFGERKEAVEPMEYRDIFKPGCAKRSQIIHQWKMFSDLEACGCALVEVSSQQ
ncbi:hypothetical protein BJ508DRAFT_14070 [Ascobolus immersus RN42]|uniref:Uncharacterized protein n=1 Tax=Ascobolus immersus RN42 TaxID=1160509 RepID=A0A3N4IUD3_ASCIM|nr:hypothetical protein BJ508DRAFT_14070 [Ascobolus immersus RN42]